MSCSVKQKTNLGKFIEIMAFPILYNQSLYNNSDLQYIQKSLNFLDRTTFQIYYPAILQSLDDNDSNQG
jgi:hypothetical protein